jgi:hypothetical protein
MSAKTFEVGTRVYHTDIERQGVVTGIGAFPNTLRIRFDGADIDTHCDIGELEEL